MKTAASHGSMEPVAANLSQSSLGRRRSSIEWFKNKLTLKLRIKDPLITKQSKQCLYFVQQLTKRYGICVLLYSYVLLVQEVHCHLLDKHILKRFPVEQATHTIEP